MAFDGMLDFPPYPILFVVAFIKTSWGQYEKKNGCNLDCSQNSSFKSIYYRTAGLVIEEYVVS